MEDVQFTPSLAALHLPIARRLCRRTFIVTLSRSAATRLDRGKWEERRANKGGRYGSENDGNWVEGAPRWWKYVFPTPEDLRLTVLTGHEPVKQPWLQSVTGEVEGLAMLHSATRADQVRANDSEARQGRCKDNPGCEWHPAS